MKQNLTKYDMLAYLIHRTAPKCTGVRLGGTKQLLASMSKEEHSAIWKAIIVCSFSSGHSWQTHKAMTTDPSKLNTTDIRREFEEAITGKWKKVTSADINEVVNSNISDNAVALWGYFNIPHPETRDYIKKVWRQLNTEFMGNCDVENIRQR